MGEQDIKKAMDNPDEGDIEHFNSIDKDGDGNVTMDETKSMVQENYLPDKNDENVDAKMVADMVREAELELKYELARFKKADLDGDGKHTLKEFVYGQRQMFPELDELLQDPESEAQMHITSLDTDKDGSISEEELFAGHE